MITAKDLADYLQKRGVLKTSALIKAFEHIDRADFVPADVGGDIYVDAPLSIGLGQTISQPWTVAFMLELLQPQPGEKILDIGSGSGWQTALLAHVVSSGTKPGSVFGIEVIQKLHKQSILNISKYNFIKSEIVHMLCVNAKDGLQAEAPFDKIICAAMLSEIPPAWKEQLNIGGRMVAPVGGSIACLIKQPNGYFMQEEYYGFAFVPFVD